MAVSTLQTDYSPSKQGRELLNKLLTRIYYSKTKFLHVVHFLNKPNHPISLDIRQSDKIIFGPL
jgi:hypothetical protein